MNIISSLICLLACFIGAYSITVSTCDDPLACYLETLSFSLPTISVDVEGETFTISNTVCSGIELTSIPSGYTAGTTLSLGVDGLGTSCEGDYSYGKLMKGKIDIVIANTDASMDLYVEKDNLLPVLAELSSCSLDSIDINIKFSKAGLEFLAPFIEAAIKKVLVKILCDEINSILVGNVTSILVNKVDPVLTALMASQPDQYPSYGNHYLNWNSTIIASLHNIINSVRGTTTMPDFLKCMGNKNSGLALFRPLFDAIHIDLFTTLEQEMILASSLEHRLVLDSIDFSGTDSLNNFEILEPIPQSKVALRTALGLEQLQMTANLALYINETDKSGVIHTYRENISAIFNFQDINLILDLVVAIDDYLFKSYYLDQIMTTGCLLSVLTEVSIPNFVVDLSSASISLVQISGDAGALEKDIVNLLDNTFQMLLSDTGFGPLFSSVVPGIFQGPVRTVFNRKVAQLLSESKTSSPCLTHYPYNDEKEYVQWPQSNLLNKFNILFNDKIGYSGLNQLFSCGTNGTSSLTVSTAAFDMTISGLSSFYQFSLLAPFLNDVSKQYNLNSKVAAGYCPDSSNSLLCTPLSITISSASSQLLSSLVGSNSVFSKKLGSVLSSFQLELSFQNLALGFETLTMLNKNGIRDLRREQMGVAGCYATSVDQLAFQSVTFDMTDAYLIYKNGEKEKVATQGVTKLLSLLINNSTVAAKNEEISKELSNANTVCALGGSTPPDPANADDDTISGAGNAVEDSETWKWELSAVILAALLILVALIGAYNYYGRTQAIEVPKQIVPVERHGNYFQRLNWETSIVFRPELPDILRYAVPIIICANIGLFCYANMSTDAIAVMAVINYGNESKDLGAIFHFSLSEILSDMWDAKTYLLAILLTILSAGLPYLKLCFLLYAWIAPTKLLSINTREIMILGVDVLGKWSLLDFFVMTIMMCAYYFTLPIGQNLTLDLSAQPRWGIFAFILATLISFGLGHIVVACHRLLTEPKVLPIPVDDDPRESISSIVYEIEIRRVNNLRGESSLPSEETKPLASVSDEEDSLDPGQLVRVQSNNVSRQKATRKVLLRFTMAGKVILNTLIIGTAVLVLMGTLRVSSYVEFKGLTGYLLGENAVVDYSFVDIGTTIPEHSGIPTDINVRWMQAAFFALGLAMPLACLFALLIIWNIPLRLKYQRNLYVLLEIFNSWSCLDCFSLSLIASLLEITQYASFVIGDSCDSLNAILAKYLDPVLDGDDTCIDVYVKLTPDCWMLFLAASLLVFLGLPLVALANYGIKQRLKESPKVLLETIERGSRDASVLGFGTIPSYNAALGLEKCVTEEVIGDNGKSSEYTEISISPGANHEGSDSTSGSNRSSEDYDVSTFYGRIKNYCSWIDLRFRVITTLEACGIVELTSKEKESWSGDREVVSGMNSTIPSQSNLVVIN